QRPFRGVAIRAFGLRAKTVKRGQCAGWGDFEDRAKVAGPAAACCSVEVPVGGLDQPRVGVRSVRATGLDAKTVKRGQSATRGDLEDRSTATDSSRTICVGCPVEVPVGAQDQPRIGEAVA